MIPKWFCDKYLRGGLPLGNGSGMRYGVKTEEVESTATSDPSSRLASPGYGCSGVVVQEEKGLVREVEGK